MRRSLSRLALTVLALLAGACSRPPAPSEAPVPAREEAAPASSFDRSLLGAFAALPELMTTEQHPITAERVALGRRLYHDERFSLASDISCNSCHRLDAYGVDNRSRSPGHEGQLGGRNSPTVYNAAGHLSQFWDGRAADVEEQAVGPVTNPVEMAMPDAALVLARIQAIPGYVEAFRRAFPEEEEPVSFRNFGRAIGAFERGLVTPGRWDDFLKGDDAALTAAEKEGLVAFVSSGCTACHAGAYLGGNMYQQVGLVKPWPNQEDLGRFEVTGEEADRLYFKVPGLRNVAETGPYFHDGSVASLPEAVRMMARHQLGRELDDETIASIVTFLKALTGEIPTDYVKRPQLPPTGPEGLPGTT